MAERYVQLDIKPPGDDHQWNVDDICVLRQPRRKLQFFRAKIIAMNDDEYQVLCLDTGHYESNIKKDDLMETIDDFKSKPDFKAKKCFLIGVKPTGTSDGEWSSRAKNFTAELLGDHVILVAYRSEKKANDSYDVCIYIDATDKTAMELAQLRSSSFNSGRSISPTNDSFVRLADILNRNGLAFLNEKM